MIKDATFVSVWDDCTEISSKCKVDTETNRIFDIEAVDMRGMDIDICTDEYVYFDNYYHGVGSGVGSLAPNCELHYLG